MGTRCADHVTPLYPQKLALTPPTDGGRSVGIVRVRTKATELYYNVQYICLRMQRDTNTPNARLIDPQPQFSTSMYTYTDVNT